MGTRNLRTAALLGPFTLLACAAAVRVARADDLVWGKAVTVSQEGNQASFPVVGVDAAGGATAVWMQIDTLQTGTGAIWKIRSATRAPGGAWVVSPTALSGEKAFAPNLRVAPDGAAVATWDLDVGGADGAVQGASRPAGGSFGPAVTLSALNDRPGGSGSAIAIGADGTGAVAYEVISSGANHLDVWPIVGGVIGPSKAGFAESVSTEPSSTSRPFVLAAASGTFVVFGKRIFPSTWAYLIGPLSGGSFDKGALVAPQDATSAINGRMAVRAGGQVVTTYTSYTGGLFARLDGGDPLTVTSVRVFNPALAAGPDGTVVAAWSQEATGIQDEIWAAVLPAGASAFDAPVQLSEAGDRVDPPAIAFAGNRAVVVWGRDTGLFNRIEVSDRPEGGEFDPVALTLSGVVEGSDGDASLPTIAADAAGNVTVCWLHTFRDDATGRLYGRAVTRTTGAGGGGGGRRDRKPPKTGRVKVTPERFAKGATLGEIVATKGDVTVMYPEGNPHSVLRTGTEFVFSSTEAGTYSIEIHGIGCTVFLPEGRRVREHKSTDGCASLGDSVVLEGPMRKKKNRVPFLGAGLTPGGRYSATLTLKDAAGNVSKPKRVTFHFDGL